MSLQQIATEMKSEAVANMGQPVRRKLARGLRLILCRKPEGWQLSLTRPNVTPSEKEIAICSREFGIGTAKMERDQQRLNGTTFFVVRFKWNDPLQMSFVEQEADGMVAEYYQD